MAAAALVLSTAGSVQAGYWTPGRQEQAPKAAPAVPESHLLVTSCTEVTPGGRSVLHSHLVQDPNQGCRELTSGPDSHLSCEGVSQPGWGAFGTVQVPSAKGVALWSCLVQDAAALH